MAQYPQIEVKLIGEATNQWSVLTRCCRAAKRAGILDTEIQRFVTEASGRQLRRDDRHLSPLV
jgi:hypothetical protein